MTNRGLIGMTGATLGRGGRRAEVADPLGKNDAANRRYADQAGLGVPSYVASLALKNKYSVERGLYNFKSSNTRRLDQGRADAMVGGMTRHLVLGDSVTDGYTSFIGSTTIDHARAWPLAMRDQLAVMGIPANGTGFVKMADNTIFDTRWARAGTWSNQTSWVFSSAAASTTTYVAERPGTILDVWYLNSTSTVTVAIDGATSGVNFATITGTTSGAWKKWRMYGVNINVGSTIVITLTVAGAGIGLSGVSIWTPNAGVIIDNLGMGGAKASGTGAASFADLTNGPLVVQRYVGGQATTITDAATTAGANTITSAASSFNATGDTVLGEPIDQFPDATGALFPPNTYITGRTSATVLTTNNNALVSATGKTLRIGRDPHCVHIALGGNDTQTSGAGGASVEAPAAAIKAIAALYPNSDIVLHLENQGSSVLWSTGDYSRWQQRLYTLADELDFPLYDWYDRTGSYAVASANGVFQDYQAHMIPGIYADLGSSLAQALGGGSGQPQYWNAPVYPGDTTNKAYVDGLTGALLSVPTPKTAAQAFSTATEVLAMQWTIPAGTLKVGTVLRLFCSGVMTGGTTPTLAARLRLGTLGTTGDAQVCTTIASATVAVTAAFRFEANLTVRSIGASGTAVGECQIEIDNISARLGGNATVTTFDTTTAKILTLSLVTGGTTPAGNVLQGYGQVVHP
jgi:hypothetical protein